MILIISPKSDWFNFTIDAFSWNFRGFPFDKYILLPGWGFKGWKGMLWTSSIESPSFLYKFVEAYSSNAS